jgi:hypothetical protein
MPSTGLLCPYTIWTVSLLTNTYVPSIYQYWSCAARGHNLCMWGVFVSRVLSELSLTLCAPLRRLLVVWWGGEGVALQRQQCLYCWCVLLAKGVQAGGSHVRGAIHAMSHTLSLSAGLSRPLYGLLGVVCRLQALGGTNACCVCTAFCPSNSWWQRLTPSRDPVPVDSPVGTCCMPAASMFGEGLGSGCDPQSSILQRALVPRVCSASLSAVSGSNGANAPCGGKGGCSCVGRRPRCALTLWATSNTCEWTLVGLRHRCTVCMLLLGLCLRQATGISQPPGPPCRWGCMQSMFDQAE